MSSDFQLQIPGDPAGGIHNRFFQVFTHTLLLHFDIIFIDFHGQMSFLGDPKMSAAAHAEIQAFSIYRAGYTWKSVSKPCTYTAVFKTTAYVRGFEGVFCVYLALYVEKTSISAWAAALILG